MYTDFDATTIAFNDPQKLSTGCVLVSTKGHARETSIQIPLMTAKFQPRPTESGGGMKLSMEVTDPEFHEWTCTVNKHIVDTLVKNSEALFQRKCSADVINDKYFSIAHKKDDYAPLFKMKVIHSGSRSSTKVYKKCPNDNTKAVSCDASEIHEGCAMRAIVKFVGLYIMTNGNIYPSFEADEIFIDSSAHVQAAVPYYTVDASTIAFSEPRKMSNGGVVVNVQDSMPIEFPNMPVKWDMNEPMRPEGCKKFTVELDDAVVDWGKTVDEHIIQILIEKSSEWFQSPKKLSREIIEARYMPIVKQKGSYQPTMNIKLPKNPAAVINKCNKETGEKESADDDIIAQGSMVTVTAKLIRLFFVDQNVYASLVAENVDVYNPNNSICEFNDMTIAFRDDSVCPRAVNNPNGESMQSNPVEDYLQRQPYRMFSKYTIRKRCGLTKKEFQYHMRMSQHIRRVPGREVGNGIHVKRSNVIQYQPPHT